MSIKNVLLATTATASLLLLVSAPAAFAQQSTAQQKCLNLLNRDGTAVAKQQGLESVGCLKGAATGKLTGTAQSCLTADAKGKVQKKKDKTGSDDSKFCTAPLPNFGYSGASAVNAGAVQAELDLSSDVFGTPLDPAVASCATSRLGCQCQQKVFGDVEKLADKKFAEFVKCKKTTLKNGATSVTNLRACVEDAGTAGSIAADSKGLIAKALATVNTDIAKKCDAKGVTAGAFPGCGSDSGSTLGACLDVKVECRVCQAINDMDGLLVNCDLFDDGLPNGSCASGAGPTPTPSPGPTPTPTPHVGTVLKGALTATNGRFNYNLTLGLPGANAACNTNFAGTHACTYAELQSAATAGDLAGLKDTGNNMVTSFWAIDGAQPALQQCNDDALGGSGLNWEYATAHTASRGQKVPLTNATGVLGALQSSLQCNLSGMSWVGCCQ